VKKEIDCQVFDDQMEAFSRGNLSEEGMEQLRSHARACSDCAMQLRVHEHLSFLSLDELEAAVPDGLPASIWPRVRAELAARQPTGSRSWLGSRGLTWLVPTMAAATVLLAVATGLLFAELRRVEAREQLLAQQVVEQRRWLAELDVRASASAVARTAGLVGRNSWVRALSRQENVSIAELRGMLQSLPGNVTVFSASEVDALLSNVPSWTPANWRGALRELEGEDGISAREMLGMLETLDVDPSLTLPTSRLMGLLRGAAAPGRL
jgi:hypothetical protein